jgi:signal recognition particle receptor subunit beta
MPLVDTISRTLQIKIVYYGPGLSGKTTTLETLAKQMDPSRRGDLMVLDTTGDRTLFFDWMPVELGQIRGFDVKIQLYTVPGQVRYNNTRRQVLSGVDGLVFVADSQADAIDQNKFSFMNLRENLAEQGIDLEDLPVVIQYNKQDLPNALPGDELAPKLNLEQYQHAESVAATGEGLVETLRLITRLTLQSVKSALDPGNRHAYEETKVPLDGEGLLEHIMSAEATRQAAEKDPADAMESPYAEITAEVTPDEGADEEAPAPPDGVATLERVELMERKLQEMQRFVEALSSRTKSLDSTASEIAEQTEQRAGELESRLEVAQRVLSSLGGRMAVVERRLSRMEMEDQQSRRAEELRELGRLLARVADVLGDHATTLSSDKSDASGTEAQQAEERKAQSDELRREPELATKQTDEG